MIRSVEFLLRVKAMKDLAAIPTDHPTMEPKSISSCDRLNFFLFLLMCSLLSENAAQRKRIEELTFRLKQDSKNSNRPPSSDSPFKKPASRPETKAKSGARKGHEGHGPVLLNPDKTIPVKPERCECGNTGFHKSYPYYTHQEIELPPIEPQVTHFLLFEGICSRCGRLVKAAIPEGHATGYGPRLTALIAEMSGPDRASRSIVQTFCKSVLCIAISRGAIQRAIDRASEAIKPLYDAIGEVARETKVNYIDETPWYQNGVLMWLWVMASPQTAFFKILTSRSKKAFEALIDKWAGILVSDGYGVYRNWINRQQTCLAHLMRRAEGLAERQDPQLARFGRRVFSELERLNAWAHAPPTKGEASAWYARMVHLISLHRARKDEAGKFARHLERLMGALWLFLLEDGVEPTNNRAERALRFAVLWRKMMQGTSSDKGDRWVERILSLRETCRLRKGTTFEVLVDAITCYFHGQAPDVSWINTPRQHQAP
jgi:transposase